MSSNATAVPEPGLHTSLNGTSTHHVQSSTETIVKCARPTPETGICCKELKKEERTLVDPDVVRDV